MGSKAAPSYMSGCLYAIRDTLYEIRTYLGSQAVAFKLPLHNFIAFSDYKQHLFHNKKISAASLEFIDKAKKAIFPMVSESG